MRRLPGPAFCRLSEGDHSPEALYELFRDWQRTQTQSSVTGPSRPETANGCLVLPSAGTDAERHTVTRKNLDGCRQTAPYSPEDRTRHRSDRTATAAPHAFGVDDTLYTRWQHNVAFSGSIPLHGVAA
jgi:hypothetical protein